MILINNIKYACTSCVKGHRSTRCKHTERNLLPIRKKGRPISQCNKCREERQKYRIHQKCLCKKDSFQKGKNRSNIEVYIKANFSFF
ncbi:unnamed protein product [Cunninghamella echinulata]